MYKDYLDTYIIYISHFESLYSLYVVNSWFICNVFFYNIFRFYTYRLYSNLHYSYQYTQRNIFNEDLK